jgi:hypothetical protein
VPAARVGQRIEWATVGCLVLGGALGAVGMATTACSRVLTIGATAAGALLVGLAGTESVSGWRLARRLGLDWVGWAPRHRRTALTAGSIFLVAALWLATAAVAGAVTGTTPRQWLQDIGGVPPELDEFPLVTSPPTQTTVYFGSLSAIVGAVHDTVGFSADRTLLRSQPNVCAETVVVADAAAMTGVVIVDEPGPSWGALEAPPDDDHKLGGLPFVRQPLVTPPATYPMRTPLTVHVTIHEDSIVSKGRYTVELLRSNGTDRRWMARSGAGGSTVECTQFHR